MIKKLLLSLATLSLVFGTHAFACPKSQAMKDCTSCQSINKPHDIVQNVIQAVSKTGLSAVQTKKIAEGIAEYQDTMQTIRQMKIFPVDSFIDDNFDEKRFISEMSEKYIAKIAAKAALFKYVFALLNDEQKKIFKREYAAPLIHQMISTNLDNQAQVPMGPMGQGMWLQNKNFLPYAKNCNTCKK